MRGSGFRLGGRRVPAIRPYFTPQVARREEMVRLQKEGSQVDAAIVSVAAGSDDVEDRLSGRGPGLLGPSDSPGKKPPLARAGVCTCQVSWEEDLSSLVGGPRPRFAPPHR
jgi:hypothetical protein